MVVTESRDVVSDEAEGNLTPSVNDRSFGSNTTNEKAE